MKLTKVLVRIGNHKEREDKEVKQQSLRESGCT